MSIHRSLAPLFVLPLFALLVACGDDVVEEETVETADVEVSVPETNVTPTSKKNVSTTDTTKSTEYTDDWATQR